MIKKIYYQYREQISYLFFGVMTTLVNWIVYTISLKFFEIDIEISNIIAWIIAVLFAYFTNKKYVFSSNVLGIKATMRELFLFFSSRLASGVFEILGFPILYYAGLNQAIMGIDGFLAKVLISVIVVVLNYVFSKLIVFRKK